MRGLKDVGGRHTRWLLFLQQFDIEFQYKPGRYHGNADALSRKGLQSQKCGDCTVAAVEELLSQSTLDTFGKAQADDPQLGPVIEALKGAVALPSTIVPGLRKTFLQDCLLCRKFRASSQDSVHTQLVVPCSHIKIILQQLHNDSGHLAVHRTTKNVSIGQVMRQILNIGSGNANNVRT